MAEIIGTAFVRIRAITAGLASEIKDGFDKGVADAKVDESGKQAGKDFVGGMGDETEKGMPDALGGGMDRAERDLDMPGRGEKGGREYAKGTKKGVDDETKRRNPFQGIANAFNKIINKLGMPGGRAGWMAVLGIPALGGALKLGASLLGGLVAVLGNVTTAALGAGAALAGLGAGIIPGVAALMLAFKTDTPALEEFQNALADLGDTWKQVGEATQEGLLPGLQNAATILTDKLVPIMTDFGRELGNIVGPLAEFAAHALTSEENMDAFSTILDSSLDIFATLGRIVARLADSLPKLFEAAMPLAEDFALVIEGLVTKFQTFINNASEKGTLSGTLDEWWNRAKRLGRIIGNVADGLADIFTIGAEAADPLLRRMERVTEEFSKWTETRRGRNQIREFFQNAMPVMREFNRLMGAIIRMVGEPILTGDTQGIIDFLKMLRKDFLPLMQELGEALADPRVAGALQDLAQSFIELATAAVESGAIGSFSKALTDVLLVIRDILQTPGIGPFVADMLQVVAVFKALSLVGLIPLAKGLFAVAEGIGAAVGSIAGTGALAGFITFATALLAIAAAVAAVWAVWHFWDEIVAGLQAAWEWFTKLAAPLQAAVGYLAFFLQFLAGPISMMIWFVEGILALVAAFKNFEQIKEWVTGAWDAVYGFFVGLPDMIAGFISSIPEALAGVGTAIADFFTGLPAMITEGLSALGGLAVDLGAALGNLLLDALAALPGFGADFGRWLLDQIVSGLSALGGVAVQLGQALLDAIVSGAGLIAEWAVRLPAQLAVWIGQGLFNLAQLGVDIIGRIVAFLAEALPELMEWFIVLPIKMANWIVEGLWALTQIGLDIAEAILEALIDAAPKILHFFRQLPAQMAEALAEAITFLFNLAGDIVQGLVDGLIAAAPLIADFFRNLPVWIATFFVNAAMWLLDVGESIINGLWQGMQAAWDTILEFLRSIPGRVVEIFDTAWDWLFEAGGNLIRGLIEGASEVWNNLNDLFANLPRNIVKFLAKGAGMLGRAGSRLIRFIFNGVRDLIGTLWDFFRELPGELAERIIRGLGRLLNAGRQLIRNVLSGVREVVSNLWEFFRELPGNLADRIINGLGRMLQAGRRLLGSIMDGVREVADNIRTWFRELPGNLRDIVVGAASALLSAGREIISQMAEGVSNAAEAVADWFGNLPGYLADIAIEAAGAAFDIGTAIIDAVIDGIGSMAGAIIDAIKGIIPSASDILGWLPDTPLPGPLAMGGIFTQPTRALIGEAGAEAVIPLTKPARAMELLRTSGLANLARRGTMAPPHVVVAAGGDTTMLKIENAVFTQPVDLDMLMAKVPHAYNVMTGRAGWR